MMCCDSLRQTNKDLTMQLEHLKMQLKGALSRVRVTAKPAA